MAGEPVITVVGNLARDPDLNFLPSGVAVANFTVAVTPRTYNRETSQWDDGETIWQRCTAWRDMAENIAESLVKGARVVVTGRLRLNKFTTSEGEQRESLDLDVDEVGPSLRYATAKVTKADRRQGGGQQQGGQQGGAPDPGWGNTQGWGQQPQQQQGGWANQGQAPGWAGQGQQQPPQQGQQPPQQAPQQQQGPPQGYGPPQGQQGPPQGQQQPQGDPWQTGGQQPPPPY